MNHGQTFYFTGHFCACVEEDSKGMLLERASLMQSAVCTCKDVAHRLVHVTLE